MRLINCKTENIDLNDEKGESWTDQDRQPTDSASQRKNL